MSERPKPELGPWKRQKSATVGGVLGGLALALAGWIFSGVFSGSSSVPEEGSLTPSKVQVDQRDIQDVQADLVDLPAYQMLQELRIRPRKEAGEYDRSVFGEPWADVDNNGCDTRNDVLARDLEKVRFRKNSRCVVAEGVLKDPYVGVTINYKRGPDTSPLVQIDHVVALGDAWRSGAWKWSAAQRQEFANDPNNLLAVQGQANQDKESSRADQWLPPREEYWCEYVTRQIQVKHDWDLSVAPQEKDAMIRALSTCPETAEKKHPAKE